jgi:hypothetical protein
MKQMRCYMYITVLVHSAIYSGLPNMYKKQMCEPFQQETETGTDKKGSLDSDQIPFNQIFFVLLT